MYLVSAFGIRGKRVYMSWYIVYKGKPLGSGTLQENLERHGIDYYIPVQLTGQLQGDRMVEKQESVLSNLIFIQADENIQEIIRMVDGLKSPYKNITTGQPAKITDAELQRFRRVLEARSLHAEFLPDGYRRFEGCPKVRVRAGMFEGLEGRVFRIRHDRKLIINIDNMAVAISGIHHSLLEIID